MDVNLIQPICWSQPKDFFHIRNEQEHQEQFNTESYCYMLSGHMISGLMREDSSLELMQDDTFFQFLLKKSSSRKLSDLVDDK